MDVVFQFAAGFVAAAVFQLDCLLLKHQTEDSYPDHEPVTAVLEVADVQLLSYLTTEASIMAETKQVVAIEDCFVEKIQE